VPEGRRKLEFGFQPMVECPPYRFAFLLPDEVRADRNLFLGRVRTSVGQMH
jgi:hypothetical protein